MLIVRYNIDGRTGWASVVNFQRVKVLFHKLKKAYKNIHLWVEDMSGRVVFNVKAVTSAFRRIINIVYPRKRCHVTNLVR